MVLTVSFALSPVTGLSCHCHLADTSAKLDASVGASGPHDFAVRLKRRSSLSASSVHRIPRSTSVTIAKRPSERAGRRGYRVDLGRLRTGMFFDLGLDHPNYIDRPAVFALTPHAVTAARRQALGLTDQVRGRLSRENVLAADVEKGRGCRAELVAKALGFFRFVSVGLLSFLLSLLLSLGFPSLGLLLTGFQGRSVHTADRRTRLGQPSCACNGSRPEGPAGAEQLRNCRKQRQNSRRCSR